MGTTINNLKTLCRAVATTLLGGAVALSVALGAPSLTVAAATAVPANTRAHCSGAPEQIATPPATKLGDSAGTLSSKGSVAPCQGYPEQRFG